MKKDYSKSKSLIVSLIVISLILLFHNQGYSQDLILLNSGLEIKADIISKNGKKISYYNLKDEGREVHEISRKLVKWHRFEYLTRKRMSISFSFGGVPYSTANSLKKYMNDNGYNGSSNTWLGTISYPVSHVQMPFILEFEYLIKPPHGISFEFAHTNKGSVQGRRGSGIAIADLSPEIYYSNPQFSASYKYYFKTYKSAIQAGFIMNKANIKEVDDSYFNNSTVEDSKISWGFLIGYTGSLVEQKIFFMRFQTQFRYIFPVEFTNDELFMDSEKIGLSHFFIGLQTGVKIYTKR
jgi:hypothetical protein